MHSSDSSLAISIAENVEELTIYSIIAGKEWPGNESLRCGLINTNSILKESPKTDDGSYGKDFKIK